MQPLSYLFYDWYEEQVTLTASQLISVTLEEDKVMNNIVYSFTLYVCFLVDRQGAYWRKSPSFEINELCAPNNPTILGVDIVNILNFWIKESIFL